MRRVMAGASLLAVLAGCGWIIGVDQTYIGPADDTTDASARGDDDGGAPVTSGSVADASSPIDARAVPFDCDAGAGNGGWGFDCTFGASGSVALADESSGPTKLASLVGDHLYGAVPLDADGASVVVGVSTGAAPAEARAIGRFTGPPVRDVQASEPETLAANGRTVANIYVLLGVDPEVAELYALLWTQDPSADGGRDSVVAPVPRALPDAAGSARGIAHVGELLSDILVLSQTDGGPHLLDVGTSMVNGDYLLNHDLPFDPFLDLTAVAPYPEIPDTVYWVVGPSVPQPQPGCVYYSLNDFPGFVLMPFVPAAVQPVDSTSAIAIGPVAPPADGGTGAAASFMLGTASSDHHAREGDDADVGPYVMAASFGTFDLPAAFASGSPLLAGRTLVPGTPPTAQLTFATLAPSTSGAGDALVLARYTVTPDQMLDFDAAMATPFGAEVDGTSKAALDPSFGVGGVVTLPLGYGGSTLGAIRVAADGSYFATLRVTRADGSHPTALVHVRGNGS